MKRFLMVTLSLLMAFSLFAAGSGESTADEGQVRIAIVLSTGGLGDQNFNDMAYAGLSQAVEDYGISFDYYEPETVSDFEPALRQFADLGTYDLIIGIGSDMCDAFTEVTPDYPDQKFSIIDSSELWLDNVRAVATSWQEQTFLCGVYAGLGTLSDMPLANDKNVIGVILGVDSPVLRMGVVGFEAGAKYVNPDVEVIESVIGSFNDPTMGREIGISMNNRGADFIQHIAGASGLGLFNAAVENQFYAFGVGGNQNHIEPSVIAATSIRNVNEMVYNEVVSIIEGTWQPGYVISGLAEGSVGYSNENSDVEIPDYIAQAIEDIRQMIVSGELVICDSVEGLDDWVSANHYEI